MDEEIETNLIRIGKIAAQARRDCAKRCVEGASYKEILDQAEEYIVKEGGIVTWAQMSKNEAAAHYCPTDEEDLTCEQGDVIKIDIGVDWDGYIADNAMTVAINTDEYNDMMKASQNALKASMKLVRPGVKLWELGEAQASEVEAMGFKTIKNLSGHNLEQNKVHAGITIPSYNNNDNTELEEGMQIAIEPFVTSGEQLIQEKGDATIFMEVNKRPVRSPYARKLLTEIKTHNGLPITTRWLTRKFGKPATTLGMRELLQSNVIRGYPPLVSVSNDIITQFEHSAIVKDKPIVYTRHEDDEW